MSTRGESPFMRVNMHDAKTNLSRRVASAESGETDEHGPATWSPASSRPVTTHRAGPASGPDAFGSTTTSTRSRSPQHTPSPQGACCFTIRIPSSAC